MPKHRAIGLKKPKELQLRKVCAASGRVPSENCEHILMDYFIPLVSSTTPCNHLQKVFTAENETFSYCMHCLPQAGYKEILYPNYSVDMIDYFKKQAIGFKKVPPHNPNCNYLKEGQAPKINTPKHGTTYYIMQDQIEPLVLECYANTTVKKVFWYVNNIFFKEAKKDEKVLFEPTKEGIYKISCSDDAGNNTDIEIEVVFI